MKKLLFTLVLLLSVGLLAACGSSSEGENAEGEKKEINFGATAGPYSDMVTKAIKPILEEKGYTVTVTEFSDYIQPNMALSTGDIDANLFQHLVYLESFAKEHQLELSEVVSVPTAPMGIYSNTFASLDEVADGSSIAIPNDPTNAARAFLILQDAGLITLDPDVSSLTVSEKNVLENVKNLKFEPIEAAQLPRAVESVDLAAVPGNFALAAEMNLLDALQLENMPDQYRNRVAVKTADLDAQFVKDIKEAVESAEFEETIDAEFEGFGKPEWMTNR
ncbi:MetQ/NlpA family ABC transporter substrate-binding protein [Litchfieldia alkalitelluris]|uniref:MetQ/NlpA family ABC transporter substrate-binding protein n=1 Tax=Litchfieldia alkalitelluris TaxID=304268 RepID=UPI0009989EEA|nr:MetQ/NlpA family ABC transporter substrate-binding protein [Litchfieldia alkalitelluris]